MHNVLCFLRKATNGFAMSNFDDQVENLSANVRSDYTMIMKAFESKENICLLLECIQRRDLSPFELVVATEKARMLECVAHFMRTTNEQQQIREEKRAARRQVMKDRRVEYIEDLHALTCLQLRELCRQIDLSRSGNKKELIDRLSVVLKE